MPKTYNGEMRASSTNSTGKTGIEDLILLYVYWFFISMYAHGNFCDMCQEKLEVIRSAIGTGVKDGWASLWVCYESNLGPL